MFGLFSKQHSRKSTVYEGILFLLGQPQSSTERSEDPQRLEDPYLFSVFNPPRKTEPGPEHAVAK